MMDSSADPSSFRPLRSYQKHVKWFAEPRPPYRITLLSALRGGLGIGLDFPVALGLALGMRLSMAPFPFLFPGTIYSISGWWMRSNLEGVSSLSQKRYTCSDLLELYDTSEVGQSRGLMARLLDKVHIASLWVFSADRKSLMVDREEVERFQEGEWAERMAERRRVRDDDDGNVLPFWRGGPISATGHSWFVDSLFGVKVYQKR